ncbi:phosphatidate cytidylyltransferase [Rhodobacter capsulatus]|uniref:phosphatidate cytidylyltransferase n=1 Tax=Rhodobacter capsulatus TaxID=1061 RepID=UPI0040288F6B
MSGNWSDLRARTASGLAMVAAGALAIWLGGLPFILLAVLVTGLMIWELAAMTTPEGAARWPAVLLGLTGAVALFIVVYVHYWTLMPLLILPAALGSFAAPRRDRAIFAAYAITIMLAGYALVALCLGVGPEVILWLVCVVVASDVGGYFAGRALGGPKFWPRVSPKKTWSGTVAGWFGAAAVGGLFAAAGPGGLALVWLSPIVALAGQMGDIAESAIKRRMGVKDSSALIPGHGGVLDRFDALIGAALVVLLLVPLMPQTLFGG